MKYIILNLNILFITVTLLTFSGCPFQQPKAMPVVEEGEKKLPFAAPEVPPAPSQKFVGSQACVECHSEIHEHYSHHPMGRSLAAVLDPNVIEDYQEETTFETQPAPRSSVTTSYEIAQNERSVIHREIQTSADGTEIYQHDVPMDYRIGSGQKGRSYLTNRSGLLFMSPVTWYTEGNRWDISPGYKGNNLHFTRRIVEACLSCHTGRLDKNLSTTSPDTFKSQPFIEASIGCERCHGPGEEHIQFQNHEIELAKDPIVNPIDLPPRERDHVCFQCHLIGEHRLTRYGREEFDFRPGDNISDIWTVFLKGDGFDEGETTAAVSQVEQMLGSACYQKSNQKLGCISCHEPHSRPEPAEEIAFYRTKCLDCHGTGEVECSEELSARLKISAEDSCIQCHMPQVSANDVPHTSQTDHRVLTKYESTKEKIRRTRPSLYIFGENENLVPEKELERAQAISICRAAEGGGNPVLAADAISILKEWIEVVPDDIDALVSLGTAYWLLQEPQRAMDIWIPALEKNPDHEYLLRRLMVLCHETEQLELGVEYGKRLTKVNPWDFEYFGRLAHMYGQLEKYDEGISAANRALELNPAASHIHQWLAEVYQITKQPENSEYHQEMFNKLSATK
mgnify:CR=1 FL=1